MLITWFRGLRFYGEVLMWAVALCCLSAALVQQLTMQDCSLPVEAILSDGLCKLKQH
jgi:hypothetical protein